MPSLSTCLQSHFLIAMPNLHESLFNQALILICEHSEQGAMGLILNYPLHLTQAQIFNHLQLPCRLLKAPQRRVLLGGPMQFERGFVLHSPAPALPWLASQMVSEHLQLTQSLELLETIARGQAPEHYLLCLGYTGWGPGQLEQELINNLWLSCPANFDIIFSISPDQRLQAAAASLGVDLDMLTPSAGHS